MADTPRPRDLRSTLAARRDRNTDGPSVPDVMPESPKSGPLAWPGRIALMLGVLLIPWAFGGVYTQAQFYVSLALVVSLVCWWVDMGIAVRKTELTPILILPLAGGILLGICQLLPLADVTAKAAVPLQHEIYSAAHSVVQVDKEQTFSLSLDREATWTQVRLLSLAFAGLLLGAGLFQRREDAMLSFTAITANGIALTFFALAQKVSWNGKIYWTWSSLTGGEAFGPFINRNNAAGYLLLCLAAAVGLLIYVWNNQKRNGPRPIISREMPIWRQWQQHFLLQIAEITAAKLGCLFACGFLALGIIATLSRGGVSALLAGGILTLLAYGMARKPKTGGLLFAPVILMVVLLGTWIGFFEQLTARFENVKIDEVMIGDELDTRVESWTRSLESRSQSGWLGSGLGTYPLINRMYWRQRETGITEYAENQFVQSLVDGGWPALLLVLTGVLLSSYSGLFMLFKGFSPATLAIGGAGTFLVVSQSVSGFFDFGWYIPANMLLGSVLVGMIGFHSHYLAHRLKEVTALRWHLPSWLANVAAMTAFALCVLVAVDLFSASRVDAIWMAQPSVLNYKTMPLEATDKQIEHYLSVKSRRTSVWYSKLGALYLHRARLAYFDLLSSATPLDTLAEERRLQVQQNLWELTSLSRMEEQAYMSEEQGGYAAARNFRSQPFFKDLALALECYVNSVCLKPAQPETLTKMSQLQFLFNRANLSEKLSDLAIRLAPTNVSLQYAAGLTKLFDQQPEKSAPHFRRVLELAPEDYNQIIVLLKGLSGRIATPVNDRLIAEKVLPSSPRLLHQFATTQVGYDNPLRGELLDQAEKLLNDVLPSDSNGLLLKADVLLAKGDRTGGIKQLERTLVSDPYNHANRLRLVELLIEERQLIDAKKHLKQLLNSDSNSSTYNNLMKKVNELIELERSNSESGPTS